MKIRIPIITYGFIGIISIFLLTGCQALSKKQQSGVAVEVHGQYLYRSTLDSLTIGLNSEDSLRIAQQYISQWAKDILISEEVKNMHSSISKEELDRMVEDYRRTLYAHAYEEYLVTNQMSRTVPDSIIQHFYHQMPERFLLNESIVKGMLVVIPSDAPNSKKLRAWMADESLDEIEKYAYQLATGYELFTDKWLTTTDIISRMPIERENLETRLKIKNQIEVTDSLNTYLFQVTDKELRGAPMPMEYARKEIEMIILNDRQVEFLNKERERLYEESVQRGEVKYY